MGVVGALSTLPDLVFGMIAGALADRSDRKRMMFLADLGRAMLTALIPISVVLGGPTMAVILLVDGADEHPPRHSSWPATRRRSRSSSDGRRSARANSYLRGGLLVRLHRRARDRRPARGDDRPGLTLAIDAASFAISSFGLADRAARPRAPRSSGPEPAAARPTSAKASSSSSGQPVLRPRSCSGAWSRSRSRRWWRR